MSSRTTTTVSFNAAVQPVTHLLYDGHGGWIEAKKVWIDMPHPEVDGAESGEGWHFHNVGDLIRWLRT